MDVSLNDYKGFKIWLRYYFLKLLPKIFYPFFIRYFYKKHLGKNLNLKNPITFSEKLNYLKIYDVNAEKKILADRLLAKKYIQKNYPELKTAKIYTISETYENLNFSKCPNKFIIKTNHACKSGIVIYNKEKDLIINEKKYKKYYQKVLKINYAFWGTLELQYKDISPKIYAEELLEPENGSLFKEFEVYCFNGEVEFIHYCVHTDDGLIYRKYYNKNWEETNFCIWFKYDSQYIPDDYNKDKVIEYSRKLSKEFKFVRVDFFEVNKELYFAEMTFTPFSGDIKVIPEHYDVILGVKLKINDYF